MKLSVIIPMYNEKAIAGGCAEALTKALEPNAVADSYDYEIIFSDDGSTDGCGDAIRQYAKSVNLIRGEIKVIASPQNEGKGSAVRRGMLEARGEYVLFTDCDLAYGCKIIPDMLSAIEADNNCGVLIGSRAIHEDGYSGYTFLRKLASKNFIKLLAMSAGFSHSDSQCGIKIFTSRAAREIFSRCNVNGWAFDFEALMIAEKLGFIINEFPVKVINHRESKINLARDSIKMIRDVKKIKKSVENIK